jgi:hypothetical protein
VLMLAFNHHLRQWKAISSVMRFTPNTPFQGYSEDVKSEFEANLPLIIRLFSVMQGVIRAHNADDVYHMTPMCSAVGKPSKFFLLVSFGFVALCVLFSRLLTNVSLHYISQQSAYH